MTSVGPFGCAKSASLTSDSTEQRPPAPDGDDDPARWDAGSKTRFEIDRRPLPIVVLNRLRKQLTLVGLLLIFVWVIQLEPPAGLEVAGWRTLVIFGLCAVLWASALLPLAITSLLAMCLLPLAGVMSAEETYSYFGSKVVFFLLGALMLSAAMITSGLSRRLATLVVERFGRTPTRLVMAVFSACALASTVMTVHAVAVMVLPLIIDIGRALKLKPGSSNLGRSLSFAMAWGCVIGGALTVLGGARGPLAIGILETASGGTETIGFVEYIAYGAPMVAIMLIVGALMLRYLFPSEIDNTEGALVAMRASLREMGKIHPREVAVGAVMVATVIAWATAGDTLGLDTIAIIAMAALFALRAVGWKAVQEEVNWGIILMYGGALCLAAAMAQSGAARWVTDQVFAGGLDSPKLLLLLLALVSAVLTEFMSNSAVVAMLLPPTLSLAGEFGIDLSAATMAIVLPSNFAFMFPISTPVTALAWSTGYYTPSQVVRTGAMLHLVGFGCIALLIFVWWPAMGLI